MTWLARRHSLAVEAFVVVLLYMLSETSRGLVAGTRAAAVHHAHEVASLEQSLHLFVERDVQHAVAKLPGVLGTLSILYLTLHLVVTGGYLLWLHRRRPAAYAVVRTTLAIAGGLACIGYVAFATAPPRLASLGVADAVSQGAVNLNHGLISSLYNPFAAVPSMHVGYAVIVGASLVRHGRHRPLRVVGCVYPALVLLIVVATGNHFLFDGIAGATVALLSGAVALFLVPSVHEDEREGRDAEEGEDAAEQGRVLRPQRLVLAGVERALDTDEAQGAVGDERDGDSGEAGAEQLERPARHIGQAGDDLSRADGDRERRQRAA